MKQIVDIHPHVISPDTATYPLQPLGGNQSSWSQAHTVTAEDLITAMDGSHVAKAVVVQASTAYGHDNRLLSDTVAAYPERLAGVFSVDVLAEDAVERIRYWQGRGLCGLRLFTAGSTMPGQADWLNDARSHPAWAYASSVRLPICVQMRPAGIPKLRDLLDRFPDAIVIVDHLARPELDDGSPYTKAQALWDLAAYPNIHLKLTLRNIDGASQGDSTIDAFMAKLMTTFGADRVVWGSNFPAAEKPLSYLVTRALEAIAPLDHADQRKIMGGTALKLYPSLLGTGAAAKDCA